MKFERAFDELLGHEGGYSFNPNDPGGETMYGVTARVALKNGYTGPMRNLPREKAAEIYRALYWDACQCGAMQEGIRYAVFDAAVNSGVSQSIKWLQRALDIGEDGSPGSLTITCANREPAAETVSRAVGYRLEMLTSLPTWGAFGRGWARRLAKILQMASA